MNFLLSFLFLFFQIRTIFVLVILYFFISIGSNGEVSLELPNLQNFSITNLNKGIQDVKKRVLSFLKNNNITDKDENYGIKKNDIDVSSKS